MQSEKFWITVAIVGPYRRKGVIRRLLDWLGFRSA